MSEHIVSNHEKCPFYWADGDECSLEIESDITCPKPMGEKLGFVKDWWVPDECPLKTGPVIVRLKEWNDNKEDQKKDEAKDSQKNCTG